MTLLAEIRARRTEILALAKRHGMDNIRIFGSVARGEEGENSDVDFLVQVRPGYDLFDLMDFHDHIAATLGRDCDVLSDEGIHPFIRTQLLAEAVPL